MRRGDYFGSTADHMRPTNYFPTALEAVAMKKTVVGIQVHLNVSRESADSPIAFIV
jgi:hypothetical protein